MLSETTDYCRLILLRHPELDSKFTNIAVGGSEAAVGRRGQTQVMAWFDLLESVPVSTIYCATQSQCVDPARALAVRKQVDVQEDPRLNDQHLGSWQGRTWEDIVKTDGEALREFFAEFGESTPPGGENLGEALERMLGWWQEVAPGALQKTLLVIASGSMISGFATALLGIRLSRSVSLNLPHGGLGILDCFANGARITSWNPTAILGSTPPESAGPS